MAREEVTKTRTHIDLVGATNMGTTMAKPGGISKSKPKAKAQHKVRAKSKMVDKIKADKAKKKTPPIKSPPAKKKP